MVQMDQGTCLMSMLTKRDLQCFHLLVLKLVRICNYSSRTSGEALHSRAYDVPQASVAPLSLLPGILRVHVIIWKMRDEVK